MQIGCQEGWKGPELFHNILGRLEPCKTSNIGAK